LTGAPQDFFENRDIFNSLELGWELLRILPTTMLGRIKMKTIDKCGAVTFTIRFICVISSRFRANYLTRHLRLSPLSDTTVARRWNPFKSPLSHSLISPPPHFYFIAFRTMVPFMLQHKKTVASVSRALRCCACFSKVRAYGVLCSSLLLWAYDHLQAI
jgi:hypothetical protein